MVVQPTSRALPDLEQMADFEHCWYCTEPLEGARVFWHGWSAIWLHPVCAQELGRHLLKDSYEVLGAAA